MKMKELEMALSRLPRFPQPKPELEQVATPASIAARVLYSALGNHDLADHRVLDLGCGTGTFAIGAALLGASHVAGVEKDPDALALAREAACQLGADVDWYCKDVSGFDGDFDTVIMNPPFGAQKSRADRPFLETAFRCARVVYSMHLAETRNFVELVAGKNGFELDAEQTFLFPVSNVFSFHTKGVVEVPVALVRMVQSG